MSVMSVAPKTGPDSSTVFRVAAVHGDERLLRVAQQ